MGEFGGRNRKGKYYNKIITSKQNNNNKTLQRKPSLVAHACKALKKLKQKITEFAIKDDAHSGQRHSEGQTRPEKKLPYHSTVKHGTGIIKPN